MPTLTYTHRQQEHQRPVREGMAIGRTEDNDLCVPCPSISSRHAVIRRAGDGLVLEDQGSRNGIVAGGHTVQRLPLRDGVVFALGEVEFRYRDAGADDVALPSAASLVAEPEPELPAPPPPTVPTPAAPAGMAPEASPAGAGPEAVVARFRQARERILEEVGKLVIGQREVLDQVLVALFAGGHCLLVGVPGLAKTLMVRTLGGAVALEARRIQFTPDLMPSDITGTEILEEDAGTGRRVFRFHRGPIFANLLLADEINRTPPKTQAALLEAMQEHRVTISGTTYDLPAPFMVLATQNPIEQEGTYPLPEAQLDRFMFCVHLGYPSMAEERRVILDTTRELPQTVQPVLTAADVVALRAGVRQIPVSEHVAQYALNLVRATRPDSEGASEMVKRWVRWGAGTRAGQYLLLAAKAHALLQGRTGVACRDVAAYALPVLRHRIFPNFTAASEGVDTDQIVAKVLAAVAEPDYRK
jgi:MoxR-like ATPase